MAIARTSDGINLIPIPQFPFAAPDFLFSGPIHSRGHWVSFVNDHINKVDPIAVGSAETVTQQTYSPLRSAATFTNPQNTATTSDNPLPRLPGPGGQPSPGELLDSRRRHR